MLAQTENSGVVGGPGKCSDVGEEVCGLKLNNVTEWMLIDNECSLSHIQIKTIYE